MNFPKSGDKPAHSGGLAGFRPMGLRTPFGFLSQPVFAPDDGTGGGGEGGDDTPPEDNSGKGKDKIKDGLKAKDKAPAPAPVDDSAAKAAQERAAALETQLAELQGKLGDFGDATPEEIKELRDLKRRAAEAEKKASDEAKKAEEERLRKEGDFEALKRRMAEEHERDMQAAVERAKELESTVGTLSKQISDMALNTSFAASRFISEEMVLTPTMARKVFAEHFEVEGGQVVAYDAPRGSDKRSKIVDARGNAMGFDEAMKRIVEASPERDMLLKAKQKPGSGTKPSGSQPPQTKNEPSSVSRIAQGLAGLRLPR